MEFADILEQTITLLQHQGRISYGALKRRFDLDDAYLDDLKTELIEAQQLARDENGRILVWVGPAAPAPPPILESALSPAPPVPQGVFPQGERYTSEAERRQLTVLFCDLVDSTPLAGQLDPEDLRDVIHAYQDACATVIERLEGHIAQYLGDGLLVYFGYPQAHEDDAQRAVRAGLGMVAAMQALNTHLAQRHRVRIAVRIGIHTGVVVVGEMGSGSRQEQLALGETPNLAARLQGLATPDTVVLSAATLRLVEGYFTYQEMGVHFLKGVTTPLPVYRILSESGVQSRLEAVVPSRLTPLVGREEEVALLHQRWEQAKAGQGQVVLLSGEAGIGKSRLVQVLKDHVAHEPHARIEWRGSAYHQQSALYPIIAHLHRRLRWRDDETPQEKLHTLETTLATSGLALPEVVPWLAALLSLPLPAQYPALTLTPQQRRQKTLETLLAWLYAEARRQPVLVIVEDLHWIDPSTLELLSLLIDQVASARLCLMLTARPEFRPPWSMVAHLTTLTLRRFAPAQVTRLAAHVAGDKALPAAVLEEVVRKTDGVPLFVEELTKVVLESGLLLEQEGRYDLTGPLPPLAIPATLHDALMARLDRLAAAKLVAQLGAVIGRALCHQIGETSQLFPTLRGLRMFYLNRGALPTARELGEQLLRLAQSEAAATYRMEAHAALGTTLFLLGEYIAARMHLEQGVALTDLAAQRAQALGYGVAPGVTCLAYAAWTLWCLGYPVQAMRQSQKALALAQELAHPYTLAAARYWAAFTHYHRREVLAVQAQANALLTLATVQRFPLYVGWGTFWRGWALAMQSQGEAGLAQMYQGMAAVLAAGQMVSRPYCLVLLAEAAGRAGQIDEGLRLLAEALTACAANAQGDLLAERCRLQGELLLQQAVPDAAQAEACFQQALAIARRQQAKSWELRAATSLSRLWQQQGKHTDAYELMAPIYGWFTEGCDTADLQDAKALLESWGADEVAPPRCITSQ